MGARTAARYLVTATPLRAAATRPGGRPPRAAKAQARAAKAAVAATVAAVDRAIAAAERCREAEAQQEDTESTRQVAGPRQRAHAPADTGSGAEGAQTARPKRTRR